MQYDKKRAKNLSLDMFIKILNTEGLNEIERPLSTKPINNLRLFNASDIVLNRIESNKKVEKITKKFPIAEDFYHNAIKMPIWSHKKDYIYIKKYIQGIKKVALFIENSKNLSYFKI